MELESDGEGKDYSSSGAKKEIEDEGNCPSCGYYVGSASICQRCGAHTKRRLSVKLIRKIAVIGSLLGVVLVWLAAYNKKPPKVELSEINKTMNNALITVEGTVSKVNKEGNDFSIVLKQDEQKLRLRGFNNLNRFEEVLGDNFPGVYDRIQVTGTIQTSLRYGSSMFLSIPERIKVLEKCRRRTAYLADLSQRDVGRCVVVEGQVAGTREFSAGQEFQLMKDRVKVPLTIFNWQAKNLPKDVMNNLQNKGTEVKAFVRVSEYAGDLQLQLVDPNQSDAVEILGGTSGASELKTGNVSLDHEGQAFQLDAMVTGVQSLSNGTILTVDDGSGPVDLFIWEGNEENINRFSTLLSPREARLSATVQVSEYDNAPQLRISDFNSVQVSEVN